PSYIVLVYLSFIIFYFAITSGFPFQKFSLSSLRSSSTFVGINTEQQIFPLSYQQNALFECATNMEPLPQQLNLNKRYPNTEYLDAIENSWQSLKYSNDISHCNKKIKKSAEKKNQDKKAFQKHSSLPPSLEFSRKPRKTQYTPYTVNDFKTLTPAERGTLGPQLDDEHTLDKKANVCKVRQYATLVHLKNKTHRPKPKSAPLKIKSKLEIVCFFSAFVLLANMKVEQVNKIKWQFQSFNSDPSQLPTSGGPMSIQIDSIQSTPESSRVDTSSFTSATTKKKTPHSQGLQPPSVKTSRGQHSQSHMLLLEQLRETHERNKAIAHALLKIESN
ncbi:hypothetical protein RFI_30354, partial [Reticulomyxa filosa]